MKEKNGKYLVACSGGPDSMALLGMLIDKKTVWGVAHVNYHHRPTADRDEEIVRKYCEQYDIPFYVLDVREYEGNFQDYARVVRYRFFGQIVKKENLDGVLVAHHLDDLLETYLMQKERGSIPDFYGLKSEGMIQGVPVIRPLLGVTKKDLEGYCLEKNIPYGIDESNLSNDYKRNQIRHSVIEKMTETEKRKLKEEIDALNFIKEEEKKKVQEYLKGKTCLTEECYKKCTFKGLLLRRLLSENISEKYLEELERQLSECKKVAIRIGSEMLVKEYGRIEVFRIPQEYEYSFDSFEFLKKEHFMLCESGTSLEAVTLKKEDFPIVVRNIRPGDSIELRFGQKKLNRFFIDRKIPLKERMSWPVMLNSRNEIILVPGLGCNISHHSEKANMFCVRIK